MGTGGHHQARHTAVTGLSTFYSSKTWIEGSAVDQLNKTFALPGMQAVAAFPDLHPGKHGPVGMAALADRLYPQLIGNDIGCGMSLFALDIPQHKVKSAKIAESWRVLEGPAELDQEARLERAGLAATLLPKALGTIGGGNHFCEMQGLAEKLDPEDSREASQTFLMVHSGSRGLGNQIQERFGYFPEGLDSSSDRGQAFLRQHDAAMIWAKLNRQLIAERAARELKAEIKLIADAPHNGISSRGEAWLHRKGAAVATGKLVPLAGSRDSLSYLIRPNPKAPAGALDSLAHGAGRRYDRKNMIKRIPHKRSDLEQLARNQYGGHIVCEDRKLLVEEAPLAYKSATQVLADLEAAKLATGVLALKPLVTFKKAKQADLYAERLAKNAARRQEREDKKRLQEAHGRAQLPARDPRRR